MCLLKITIICISTELSTILIPFYYYFSLQAFQNDVIWCLVAWLTPNLLNDSVTKKMKWNNPRSSLKIKRPADLVSEIKICEAIVGGVYHTNKLFGWWRRSGRAAQLRYSKKVPFWETATGKYLSQRLKSKVFCNFFEQSFRRSE